MTEKFETVRAKGFISLPEGGGNFYIGSKEGVELKVTSAKDEVAKLKDVTQNWSNGATMTAINEELHLAETLEKKVELLQFKSEILESTAYGRIHTIQED